MTPVPETGNTYLCPGLTATVMSRGRAQWLQDFDARLEPKVHAGPLVLAFALGFAGLAVSAVMGFTALTVALPFVLLGTLGMSVIFGALQLVLFLNLPYNACAHSNPSLLDLLSLRVLPVRSPA